MKLRSIQPVPSASDRLFHASAVPAVAWTAKDDQAEAIRLASEKFRAARAARAKASMPPPRSYDKTLDSLLIEEGAAFLSFSPPRFKMKKDGTSTELKFKMPYLKITISRDPEPFKIVSRTDPATILRHARRIASRCGDEAAAAFEAAAFAFIPAPEPAAEPKKLAGWETPASGKDCRRGANTASRIVPLNYITGL